MTSNKSRYSHVILNRVFMFVLFFLVNVSVQTSAATTSASTTSERINGVSEFLLERANDNFFYVFQNRVSENPAFKCYFPETYIYASSGHLKLLLKSGKEVWKDVVDKDINDFTSQKIFQIVSSSHLRDLEKKLRDQSIYITQNVKIKIGDTYHRLDYIPLDAPQNIKTEVSKFNFKIDEILNNIKDIANFIDDKVVTNNNGCVTGAVSESDVRELSSKIKGVVEDFDKQLTALFSSDIKIANEGINKKMLDSEAYKTLKKYVHLYNRLFYYKTELKKIQNSSSSNVIKVFAINQLIQESLDNNENPLANVIDERTYTRFSSYIMGFTSLAEAEGSEQTKAIMEEMTLPPVSFGLKRRTREHTLLLGSYFGLSYGQEETSDGGNKNFTGLMVPLGFEYSYGTSGGGSFSVMVAPFDFAHPINLSLEDKDESVEFNDIVNPGIYLSYGIPNHPFVIGLGYSKGRSITENIDSNQARIMLFFAFDMPLFSFSN